MTATLTPPRFKVGEDLEREIAEACMTDTSTMTARNTILKDEPRGRKRGMIDEVELEFMLNQRQGPTKVDDSNEDVLLDYFC